VSQLVRQWMGILQSRLRFAGLDRTVGETGISLLRCTMARLKENKAARPVPSLPLGLKGQATFIVCDHVRLHDKALPCRESRVRNRLVLFSCDQPRERSRNYLHKAQDYQAFLSILALAKARHPVKMFAFSLMYYCRSVTVMATVAVGSFRGIESPAPLFSSSDVKSTIFFLL
jgi:hypothetical protein